MEDIAREILKVAKSLVASPVPSRLRRKAENYIKRQVARHGLDTFGIWDVLHSDILTEMESENSGFDHDTLSDWAEEIADEWVPKLEIET